MAKTPLSILPKCLISLLVPAVVLLPGQALAFEATLSVAPARKLVAMVELVMPKQLPNYSYMGSGTMIAYPSPITVAGERNYTRLALAPAVNTSLPLVLEGEASYYSRAGCLGCSPSLTMANGQPLNDDALTMAIGAQYKHLVGHTATVTNVATGVSVDVLITDTGGFYQARYGHRVADLTIATKQAIGMRGGVADVTVEVD